MESVSLCMWKMQSSVCKNHPKTSQAISNLSENRLPIDFHLILTAWGSCTCTVRSRRINLKSPSSSYRLDWQLLFNFSWPKDLSCAHLEAVRPVKSGMSVFTQVYQTQNIISQCKVHEPFAESPLTMLHLNYERSLWKGGKCSKLDHDTQTHEACCQHNAAQWQVIFKAHQILLQHNAAGCVQFKLKLQDNSHYLW